MWFSFGFGLHLQSQIDPYAMFCMSVFGIIREDLDLTGYSVNF